MMSLSSILLCLPLAALVPGQSKPAPGGDLRAAIREALKTRNELVRPLFVNGVKLDPLEVDRQIVYLVGQRLLRQKMVELITEDQMEQMIKEGRRKRDEFAVFEKDVQDFIQQQVDEFKKKNPDKDFWTQLRRSNTSKEEFLAMNRSTILFDKVFFPGIPSKWPDISKEAVIAAGGPQGEAFFKRLSDNVKEGQKLPPLLLAICRQWVLQSLKKWSDIRYASDGLPPSVVLQVNGRVWRTEDAIRALSLKIKPEDRERALIEIILQTAAQKALQDAGAWMSEEEFKKAYEEYKKPYEGSPFSVEVVALNFKGYPSIEAFKRRWKLEKAFERMIASEINDDNLKAHAKKVKAFLGDGRVSVDLIRLAALDDATGQWIPGGFEKARMLGDRIMDDLEAGRITFEQAMQKYSFWPQEQEHQGKLSAKSLNELRTELRETEYSDFIQGYSVGAVFFYDVDVGQTVGPIRGQDGYYIGRVTSRQPPTGEVSIDDKNMRELVKQDYVSSRFLAWVNDLARRIEIH